MWYDMIWYDINSPMILDLVHIIVVEVGEVLVKCSLITDNICGPPPPPLLLLLLLVPLPSSSSLPLVLLLLLLKEYTTPSSRSSDLNTSLRIWVVKWELWVVKGESYEWLRVSEWVELVHFNVKEIIRFEHLVEDLSEWVSGCVHLHSPTFIHPRPFTHSLTHSLTHHLHDWFLLNRISREASEPR